MNRIPKILLATSSTRWTAALNFHLRDALPHAKIYLAPDWQTGLANGRRYNAEVMVIDLTDLTIKQILEMRSSLCDDGRRSGELSQSDALGRLGRDNSDPSPPIFFAVGTEGRAELAPLLAAVGFAGVCGELHQLQRLSKRVAKYFRRHAQAECRVSLGEDLLNIWVEDHLPRPF